MDSKPKNLSIIVAITNESQAIGKDGDMIYHLKEDLKYFKETTLHHTIVCGRKTYYSFPKRPLKDRTTIVLTRSDIEIEGVIVMHSKDEIFNYANENPDDEIFIVGGDNIYHQFINDATKLYITEIDEDTPVAADSFFPRFDKSKYRVISTSDYIESDNAPKYRYVVYEKISSN